MARKLTPEEAAKIIANEFREIKKEIAPAWKAFYSTYEVWGPISKGGDGVVHIWGGTLEKLDNIIGKPETILSSTGELIPHLEQMWRTLSGMRGNAELVRDVIPNINDAIKRLELLQAICKQFGK